MTFQPVIPFGGYSGWRFLQRTLDIQQQTFTRASEQSRATDYFRQEIGAIKTADDLIADRRLLGVALTAFGLEGDINNKAFIRKILNDGTLEPSALGNRLADKRYVALSKAFGFGDFSTPRTVLSDFPDEIIDLYQAKSFETAVGNQNDDMRLALNLKAGLKEVIGSNTSPNAQWFAIMGNPPLRTVIQTALGFSSAFSQLDLDRQLDEFKSRAKGQLGTDKVADLAAPALQEKLIRNFLIRKDALASSGTTGSIALSLLQSAPRFARF